MTSVLKRILIVVAVFVGLVVGGQMLTTHMVPADQAQQKLKEGLAKAGFALEGESTPSIALRTGIQLTFPKVVIQGSQAQLKPLRIEAKEMVVMLPLSSIFGDFALQEVYLQQAAIRYDGDKAAPAVPVDAAVHEAEPSLVKLLGLLSSIDPLPYDLHVVDGTLRINETDGEADGAKAQATALFIDLVTQTSGWTLKGKGELRGKPTELTISNLAGADHGRDVQLLLRNDIVLLDYKGSRSASVPPLIQGKLVFEAADSTAAHSLLTGNAVQDDVATPATKTNEEIKTNDPLQSIAPEGSSKTSQNMNAPVAEEQYAMLTPRAGGAVRFSSDIYYRQGQVVAKNIELTLPSLQMTGEAGGNLQAPYNLQANIQFEKLDTAALVNLGGLVHENWLPDMIAAGSDAKANARVLVKAKSVTGLAKGEQLTGLLALADGVAQVSQFSMQAAGASVLGFEGAFAVTPQGPTLMGQLSGQGEEFSQFLPAITSMPLTLPKNAFGNFAISGNIRISPDDIRISDMRAKVGNTVMNIAYIHQLATRDTGIRLAVNNLDMDALLSSEAAGGMKFLKQDTKGARAQLLPPYINDLLVGLRSNYNIYLYAENYIYDGSPRDPLEIRMRASRGRVDLDQLTTRVNGADVAFSGFADVGSSVPKFKLNLQFGDLDMGRFQHWLQGDAPESAADGNAPSPESPQGTHWSNAALQWDFIPLADGEVTVKAARVLHPLGTLTNANMLFKLTNEQLTMEESTANLFNADVRMRGQLTGGALPTWQTSFSVANLEVAELRRLFPWMQSVQGRISISGVAASNGASQLAHMRNLKANFAMTGRAIQINEFDIAGAVDVLRKLNTVDNLKNSLDAALPQSNTRFDSLEGTVQVNAGAVTIPRMVLRSNRFVGTISGDGNVVDWKLNAKTTFPLSVLDAKNPPEMVLQAQGAMDNVTVSRDDRSLEQYVIRKTANDLIQGK